MFVYIEDVVGFAVFGEDEGFGLCVTVGTGFVSDLEEGGVGWLGATESCLWSKQAAYRRSTGCYSDRRHCSYYLLSRSV